MPNFLCCVGQAFANRSGSEVAAAVLDPTGMMACDLIRRLGVDIWKNVREEKKQENLHAEIIRVAQLEFHQVAVEAKQIAAQVAHDAVLQGHIERFITLVPAAIRQSLKRSDDPTGTTLPAKFAIEDEEDIEKLLPIRLPRYQPGDRPAFLHGWELVSQLGAGGFGEVWKAFKIRTPNMVAAIKFGHALTDAEASLLNEGDVLNRLMGGGLPDGVVKLEDIWSEGDEVPWLRFEYVPGGDLTGVIHRLHAMPPAERVPKVLGYLRELCTTAGYFHQMSPSVVHRDLKPSNILVAADGRLKIADFGIGGVSARRSLAGEQNVSISRTSSVQAYIRGAHTPLYAPPEQRDPKHRPHPKDDVHAIGVVGAQMFTGRMDVGAGPDFLDDLQDAGAPTEVAKLLYDCVRKPEKRPANAAELLTVLGYKKAISVPPAPVVIVEPQMFRTTCPQCSGSLKFTPDLVGKNAKCTKCQTALILPSKYGQPALLSEPRREVAKPISLHALKDGQPALLSEPSKPGLKAGDKQELLLPGNVKMTMAWCPPGTFRMGSEMELKLSSKEDRKCFEPEMPVHSVKLTKGFYAGIYPVTRGQFAQFVQKTQYKTEAEVSGGGWGWIGSEWKQDKSITWRTPGFIQTDEHPVTVVSWNDAQQFVKWLQGYCQQAIRLPSEAEWEYLCRAGSARQASPEAGSEAEWEYLCQAGIKQTIPVGQYPANPWGLCDFHGRMWEWCNDWYDKKAYERGSCIDPVGPKAGSGRVIRGGSAVLGLGTQDASAAYRDWYLSNFRSDHVGFRCLSSGRS